MEHQSIYRIVTGKENNIEEFENAVSKLIEEGYRLVGAARAEFGPVSGDIYYTQTLLKSVDEPKRL